MIKTCQTLGELRAALEGIPDTAIIEGTVHTYTQAYPVAYVSTVYTKHLPSDHPDEYPDMVRIDISLPEGFSVAKRKKADATPKPRERKASKRIPELKTLISKQLISIDNGAAFTLDDNGKINTDIATCYTCGMSWNDALITERTPTPSARCPYEHIHTELAELGHLTGQPAERWFLVSSSPVPPTATEPRALSAARPTLHLPHDPRR